MTVEVQIEQSLTEVDASSTIVVFVFEGEEVSTYLFDEAAHRVVPLAASGELKSGLYEPTILRGESNQSTILLMGVGERDACDMVVLLRAAEASSRFARSRGLTRLAFLLPEFKDAAAATRAVVEGAVRGSYDAGVMKTRAPRPESLQSVTVVSDHPSDELAAAARRGQIVGESANIARDLVNLPPNELTPRLFAERAADLVRDLNLELEVVDEAGMQELGMRTLLAVAAGSRQPPRLLILRYGSSDAGVKLALVGKGLTFDSGGLSLKTAEGMETMKSDMGGGAAVVAGMIAIARLAPEDISVTGYVGTTENMPGDNAMRPGDIVTALSGETIEINNTDAEGRLVLADVLAYAESCGATHMVDFATLTGGAVVALGAAASLSAGRPHSWVTQVADAAAGGFERVWPMPLYPEYRKAMDSVFADIKNSGGRYASALTASAFLADFVREVPWAHIDIAGTAFVSESLPYTAKGGTGVGVATIVSLVEQLTSGSLSGQKGEEL